MKILIICSKYFYGNIPEIEQVLRDAGHEIVYPNCYEDPSTEDVLREKGVSVHGAWKAEMFRKSETVIKGVDAVLVLNFEKHGVANYIGGATFLEMYDAFRLGKRIFLFNDIPEGILKDEIIGFAPTVLHGDLLLV